MKKPLILTFFLIFTIFQLPAQTHQRGHGAVTVQELSQSVFSALKDNQFGSLNNYLPDEVELRILRRRSSMDMRAVLDNTSPAGIKETLQQNFNDIITQTTGNAFNWNNYQLADAKASQIDKKNPLLYRIQMSVTNMEGAQHQVLFEGLRIRNRYYLFKQLVFESGQQPKS